MPAITSFGSSSVSQGVETLGFDRTHRRDTDLFNDQIADTEGSLNDTSISSYSIESVSVDQLTAGTIALDQYIQSGQTAYDTGTGFWLGDDDGTAKFSIGDSSGDKVTWDGTTLTVSGTFTLTGGSAGGWTITATSLYSLDSGTPSSSPTDGIVLTSSPDANLIVYEDGDKRVQIGNLSSGVFGIKVWDGSESSVLFEVSDTQSLMGGWTIGETTLANGTDIILDASNKKISINDATFGNQGIQLDYNSGTPRMYVGDGADQFFKFDGTNSVTNNSGLTFQDNFGNGSDGSVTINSNTTLTSDMYYDDLTVDATFTLTTAGYRIFVKGTLTVNGTIECDGNSGSDGDDAVTGNGNTTQAGGAGGAAISAGFFVAQEDGKTGGIGEAVGGSAGTNGINGDSVATSLGVNGAAGGDGGDGGDRAGSGGTAGTAGTATAPANNIRSFAELVVFRDYSQASPTQINGSAGSGSGAGGGGSAATGVPTTDDGAGGGGGGSGSPGGILFISAAKIVVGAAGVISCLGGDGGDGGDGGGGNGANDNGGGGGGGGAGGAGGILVLAYKTLSNSGSISVAGGAGGAGGAAGTASGVGISGDAGSNGSTGTVGVKIEISI